MVHLVGNRFHRQYSWRYRFGHPLDWSIGQIRLWPIRRDLRPMLDQIGCFRFCWFPDWMTKQIKLIRNIKQNDTIYYQFIPQMPRSDAGAILIWTHTCGSCSRISWQSNCYCCKCSKNNNDFHFNRAMLCACVSADTVAVELVTPAKPHRQFIAVHFDIRTILKLMHVMPSLRKWNAIFFRVHKKK